MGDLFWFCQPKWVARAMVGALGYPPWRRHRQLWLLAGWGMVLAVVVLGLVPLPEVDLPQQSDKLAHALEYGWLMLWFLPVTSPRRRGQLAGALFALGGLIEILQSLVPYRSGDGADMLANAAGIALILVLARTPVGEYLSESA